MTPRSRALLLGGPGPHPFAGHFRVRRGGLQVAGRLGAGEPELGWELAERARLALAGVGGGDRYALVQAAWAALRPLDGGDLVVLLLAEDADGTVLSAAGLDGVQADGRPLVPRGHPLLGPPGVPVRTGFYNESSPAAVYLGLPHGLRWEGGDVERAAGVRRWA